MELKNKKFIVILIIAAAAISAVIFGAYKKYTAKISGRETAISAGDISEANSASDKSVLDLSIFDDPKFKALKENVAGAGGIGGNVGKKNPFEPLNKDENNEKK